MKVQSKLAVAFIALATAASGAYAADNQPRRPGGQGQRAAINFNAADADKSGDVTFEEFAAAMDKRLTSADADKDGKITVGEVADEIQRMRDERMARRLIARFDTDGDGALTTAEVEGRQKKMFAMLDRNDDGKITQDEMPRRPFRGFRR